MLAALASNGSLFQLLTTTAFAGGLLDDALERLEVA